MSCLRPRHLVVVSLLALIVCAADSAVARAAPGWATIGGRQLSLGVERESEPAGAVHDGRLHVAVIDHQQGRTLLVVARRRGDDWERVGQPLNRVDGEVTRPRLLSVRGALYATWIEGATENGDAPVGRLMAARLEELPGGAVRWREALVAPEADNTRLVQLLAVGDHAAAFYARPYGGAMLAVLGDTGWQVTDVGTLVPRFARVHRAAVYGSTVYLSYQRVVVVPGYVDNESGRWIDPAVTYRWAIARAVLGADGDFRPVGTLDLPGIDTEDRRSVTIEGRQGARPLIAWTTRGMLTVAEPSDDETQLRIVSVFRVATHPDRLLVTRVADGVAVASQTRERLTVYRIGRGDDRTDIREDLLPIADTRNVTLIAGPTGQPVLTFTDGPNSSVLGYDASGPSR